MFAIPFENLDIQNEIPILLQIDSLYQKVILDHRGGYCYELNLLFHLLLSRLGFSVNLIGGRLFRGQEYGPEFEHMALIVRLNDRNWLVDVGYGDFSLAPLAVQPGSVQYDGRNYYMILDPVWIDDQEHLGVAKWNHSIGDFKTDYIFTLEPRMVKNFLTMHEFHQTSPDSQFVRSLICTLPTETGRLSLINNRLIRTEYGVRHTKHVRDEEHRDKILEKYFHMDMVYLP
jgi:N-hydroxyarylamine O-acetyltransferase